jgi:hypothetical protein
MNWAACPEGYDVGSVADSVVNGDECFQQKTPSSRKTRSFTFLHQHPDRIFKEACQRLHELRGFGSVADSVVN